MKKIIYSISALLLLTGFISCTEEFDIEQEEKAIIAVIEEETAAFIARDYDRLAANYVQDETNIRFTSGKSGFKYYVGWEELSARFKEYFKNNPEPDQWRQVRTNYKIKVYQESAWVVFENEGLQSAGRFSEPTGKGIDVRFLEKIDGKWKITFLASVITSSFDEGTEKDPETDRSN
jgi:hypothetical protein